MAGEEKKKKKSKYTTGEKDYRNPMHNRKLMPPSTSRHPNFEQVGRTSFVGHDDPAQQGGVKERIRKAREAMERATEYLTESMVAGRRAKQKDRAEKRKKRDARTRSRMKRESVADAKKRIESEEFYNSLKEFARTGSGKTFNR